MCTSKHFFKTYIRKDILKPIEKFLVVGPKLGKGPTDKKHSGAGCAVEGFRVACGTGTN
jgi:hypothetical protein